MKNNIFRSNTWVIIPAYNEAGYIKRVLKKVCTLTSRVIVIDDGSYDDTFEIAQNSTEHVLHHPINLGKGAALKTGCEYAFFNLRAQAVIFFDADDQHDAAELTLFDHKLLEGANVVLGARNFGSSMPLFRIVLNRLASFCVLLFFGTYIPDIPSGYKALTKKAYQQLNWQSTDYAVEMEIAVKLAKTKMPFSVIPIKTIYHDFHRGMTILDTLSMIVQIIRWRIVL